MEYFESAFLLLQFVDEFAPPTQGPPYRD